MAVKVIRKVDRYKASAKVESKILKQLYFMQENLEWQPNVIMYTHFEYLGHYCMVFEPLGKSLLQYVEQNGYHGFPSHMVKDVAYQLLSALDFLHRNRLCHTDLKLENILFVEGPEIQYTVPYNKAQAGHRGGGAGEPSVTKRVQLPKVPQIKLIDFGGATYEDMRKSRIINTRQYRSPEVVLELGWSYPSDVWSAACCIAEISSRATCCSRPTTILSTCTWWRQPWSLSHLTCVRKARWLPISFTEVAAPEMVVAGSRTLLVVASVAAAVVLAMAAAAAAAQQQQ